MGRPRLSPKKREKIETYARETPLSVRAVAKEVGVNGHTFKLVAEPAEVRQSANAYLIPEHGAITISIGAFVHPGEGNYMDVLSQVPPGSDADIIIADLLPAGQEIAYAIEDLQDLPVTFALLLSYPNPFTDRTTLVYRIPEQRTSDLRVRLAIYDTLGRRVQNLVDDQRFPGTFSVVWDGRDGQGQPAAAGVYLCHMLTDTHQETIRVVRL